MIEVILKLCYDKQHDICRLLQSDETSLLVSLIDKSYTPVCSRWPIDDFYGLINDRNLYDTVM